MPDRFEQQGTAFFQRVADAYRARHAAEPGRIERIDAALPPDAVLMQIDARLAARGW